MIQRIQRKFILLSAGTLLLVLVTILGAIIGISYARSANEVHAVLTVMSQNNGQLSSAPANQDARQKFGNHFNREGLFQYRYFSVHYDPAGNIADIDSKNIKMISPAAISTLANRVVRRDQVWGLARYNQTTYAYHITKQKDGRTLVTFLDQTIMMSRTNEIINTCVILGIVSFVLFTSMLIFFSKKAIGPIITAEKRQREFITNAGHELKTPLSIISANNELQEMMNGSSEWTESNKQQINRLTRLTNSLVSLARLEEQPTLKIGTVDASAVTRKAVADFQPVIKQEHKTFNAHIDPHLAIKADENYYLELVNILLDNANKYCDPNGRISLALSRGKYNRYLYLQVGNDYAAGKGIDYRKFFDRFYRNDLSHNQEKKAGFGIGLSMAQHVVESFHGKIKVKYQSGRIYFTVRLHLAGK